MLKVPKPLRWIAEYDDPFGRQWIEHEWVVKIEILRNENSPFAQTERLKIGIRRSRDSLVKDRFNFMPGCGEDLFQPDVKIFVQFESHPRYPMASET